MCQQCQTLLEQNDALQRKYVAEFEKREAVVDQVADAQRKIAALKGELTKLRSDSPKMADAEEVFRFWQQRLRKSSRTTFGPEREKKVLARLKEKSLTPDGDRKDDLKWAVRGCELLPFVGAQGRQSKGGKGAKRFDDLTLICRDETTVERFIGYADDHAGYVFRRFVEVLSNWVGPAAVDVVTDDEGQPIMFCSACPVCAGDWALRGFVGQAWVGELLPLECRSGCSGEQVRAGLRSVVAPRGLAA